MRTDCGHELINTECLECWKRRCEHLQAEVERMKVDMETLGALAIGAKKALESKLEIAREVLIKIGSKEFGHGCDGQPIGCQECGGTKIAKDALARMDPQ